MRTVCFSRQATRVSPFVVFDEASSPLAAVRVLHGGDGGDFLLGQVEADSGAAGDQFEGGKAEEVDA